MWKYQITGYVTSYSNYNALGQAGTITYANGVSTIYQYYTSNNRLYSITTNNPALGLQNISYSYDNIGNITGITDYLDSTRSQIFTYDNINRLTQAQSTSYGAITYSYNQIGNMTYNSQVGSYTYPTNGIRPHAVTQAGTNTYVYDANGNMTSGAGRTIAYNYDNMPKSISKTGGVTTTFVYNYAGQRIKKTASSVTTVYIGKLYECTSGVCTKYVFGGSNRIASKKSSTVYYYHTDHLGSSSIITDSAGSKAEEIYYYPYGGTRIDTGSISVKHKYTSQELDGETGLYNYGARYYDPILSMWISPDPILLKYFPDNTDPKQQEKDWDPLRDLPGMGGVYNSKNMNLYSYAHMNPIKLLDSNGKVVLIGGHVAAKPLGYLTKPDSYHLYLILIPDNPQDFTNRTGWINDPHGYMIQTLGGQKDWYNPLGNLQSAFNYKDDSIANAAFLQVVETPKGMTDTQFINNLSNAAASYKNNLNYDLLPELTGGYNSNSYVSGVIKAAGGTPPVLQTNGLFQIPGYYTPISLYMFNYNSTTGAVNSYNNYETQGYGSTYSSDYDSEYSWEFLQSFF